MHPIILHFATFVIEFGKFKLLLFNVKQILLHILLVLSSQLLRSFQYIALVTRMMLVLKGCLHHPST